MRKSLGALERVKLVCHVCETVSNIVEHNMLEELSLTLKSIG